MGEKETSDFLNISIRMQALVSELGVWNKIKDEAETNIIAINTKIVSLDNKLKEFENAQNQKNAEQSKEIDQKES